MDMKLWRKADLGRKPKRKQALVREHVALENEAPVDTPQPNDTDAISTEVAQENEAPVDTQQLTAQPAKKRKTTIRVHIPIPTGRILRSSTLINSEI